jgi:Holliday junction resolvase
MGRMSRDKGARAERELAKILIRYGIECRRGQVFNKEPDIVGVDGIHVEVKRTERPDFAAFMRQAVEASEKKKDGIPAVFWRPSRHPWTVVMRARDYLWMAAGTVSVDEGLLWMELEDWVSGYRRWAAKMKEGL